MIQIIFKNRVQHEIMKDAVHGRLTVPFMENTNYGMLNFDGNEKSNTIVSRISNYLDPLLIMAIDDSKDSGYIFKSSMLAINDVVVAEKCLEVSGKIFEESGINLTTFVYNEYEDTKVIGLWLMPSSPFNLYYAQVNRFCLECGFARPAFGRAKVDVFF